jgi:hypothetical protein
MPLRDQSLTVLPPPLIMATRGQPVRLPLEGSSQTAQIKFESGNVADLKVEVRADGIELRSIQEIGYHEVEVGTHRFTVAVAPSKCTTISDITRDQRFWGLAAQIYGLRSSGDCGIGDMAGVVALGRAAANIKADVLALSPLHALFAAEPSHFSPYSPSSREFYNPLHADAASVFGEASVAKAWSEIKDEDGEGRAVELVDWPRSSRRTAGCSSASFWKTCRPVSQRDWARILHNFAPSARHHLLNMPYSKSCTLSACGPAMIGIGRTGRRNGAIHVVTPWVNLLPRMTVRSYSMHSCRGLLIAPLQLRNMR